MSELAQIVARLAGHRVVVLGDCMLDEYLIGRAVRLSREAPVPVLEQTHGFHLLGGACNPAHNVVALGSRAALVGLIGDDEAGRRLVAAAEQVGVATDGLVVDPSRPTTTKTRLVAESALRVPQHLARLDRLDRRPPDPPLAEALARRLEALVAAAQAVIVSHYQCGVVTPALADRARQAARQHGALITADAQADLERFAGYDLVKCNRAEAEAALGFPLVSDADFERGLTRLAARLGVGALVVTRGAEGMSLWQQGRPVVHSAALRVSDIYDVVGAGDTVVAVLTLALAGGLSLVTAAHLANAAAGLVVRRLGNAVVSPDELVAALAEDGRLAAADLEART
ncbi:MAG: bifunctional ADP-heptose synthase [Caldilineales bacterium]|nr:bifunctional ADP-heptose synthase [Caldilineales bacterium]MDW8318441.1 bifunctional ADP-heptose synthase [Anaerolineae bacterium]